jgi:hypothetical protein
MSPCLRSRINSSARLRSRLTDPRTISCASRIADASGRTRNSRFESNSTTTVSPRAIPMALRMAAGITSFPPSMILTACAILTYRQSDISRGNHT